jgi:hypothetical protein
VKQLPIDATPAAILKASDEQVQDLIGRQQILKVRARRIAGEEGRKIDPNDLIAQANDRVLEARASLTKRNGLRIDERYPPDLTDAQKERLKND